MFCGTKHYVLEPHGGCYEHCLIKLIVRHEEEDCKIQYSFANPCHVHQTPSRLYQTSFRFLCSRKTLRGSCEGTAQGCAVAAPIGDTSRRTRSLICDLRKATPCMFTTPPIGSRRPLGLYLSRCGNGTCPMVLDTVESSSPAVNSQSRESLFLISTLELSCHQFPVILKRRKQWNPAKIRTRRVLCVLSLSATFCLPRVHLLQRTACLRLKGICIQRNSETCIRLYAVACCGSPRTNKSVQWDDSFEAFHTYQA